MHKIEFSRTKPQKKQRAKMKVLRIGQRSTFFTWKCNQLPNVNCIDFHSLHNLRNQEKKVSFVVVFSCLCNAVITWIVILAKIYFSDQLEFNEWPSCFKFEWAPYRLIIFDKMDFVDKWDSSLCIFVVLLIGQSVCEQSCQQLAEVEVCKSGRKSYKSQFFRKGL